MEAFLNMEDMTNDELLREIDNGAKFVYFQFTISIIIMTFKRSSRIYFVKSGDSSFSKSFPFTLLTLIFGWWGFPWGPIYSIGSIYTNSTGGVDVTYDVLNSFNENNRHDDPELLDANV